MTRVLITGGSSGIGKATCLALHASGYEVVGTSRKPEEHETPFQLISLDVTSEESILAAVRWISEKWGGLDVLINNAGIGFTGPLAYAKPEHIRKAWEINVYGAMRVTQLFLPLLKKSSAPKILNIGSIGGKMGLPYRGWYSAAKGSLEVLGESLAMELKPLGIQVCTLLPGDVKTPIGESRLDPAAEELHEYKEGYLKMKEILDKEMANAMSPELVAKKIEKLLRRKKLPLKKAIGSTLHKFVPIIKNLTSQRFFQWLILRHYK